MHVTLEMEKLDLGAIWLVVDLGIWIDEFLLPSDFQFPFGAMKQLEPEDLMFPDVAEIIKVENEFFDAEVQQQSAAC